MSCRISILLALHVCSSFYCLVCLCLELVWPIFAHIGHPNRNFKFHLLIQMEISIQLQKDKIARTAFDEHVRYRKKIDHSIRKSAWISIYFWCNLYNSRINSAFRFVNSIAISELTLRIDLAESNEPNCFYSCALCVHGIPDRFGVAHRNGITGPKPLGFCVRTHIVPSQPHVIFHGKYSKHPEMNCIINKAPIQIARDCYFQTFIHSLSA